ARLGQAKKMKIRENLRNNTKRNGNRRTRGALLAAAILSAFGSTSHGASLFWDADGATTTATRGTGTCITASTWRLGSATGTLQNWVDGSDAFLPQTAGTITISSAVSASSLSFSNTSGAYTVTGSTLTIGTGGFLFPAATGNQSVASI